MKTARKCSDLSTRISTRIRRHGESKSLATDSHNWLISDHFYGSSEARADHRPVERIGVVQDGYMVPVPKVVKFVGGPKSDKGLPKRRA